ncbi:MAG: 2-isopropylmalate synthase [Gammaproteobacteria bacterium]|nr:MAG: 2-isopropylmalate synthase [Gammaproteobacteria bacterium]
MATDSPVTAANRAPADRLVIFDTTLRDGEQAPGCSMTDREKLRVARALADLGVDVIEAGFPAASDGDFASVQSIAREVRGPTICGLARCGEHDIRRAWEALEPAESSRIHVFIATSPIHRKFKLQLTQEEVLRRAVRGVAMARDFCGNVEFSAEDAARTEPEFLAEVLSAVIEAGASTINVPDTVGYAIPGEFADLIRYLREHVRGIEKAVVSVHCHDDLGMAVANSLAAVEAGARQVECTVNGIGERAGNCSLEEIVMAVRTRADRLLVDTGVNSTRLYPTSRLVAAVTGVHVPRNKAVVGDNAFAHEAGIHQHGMLRHESTYEIMRPRDVGMDSSRLVLGKHSGRHAFRDRVTELGLDLDEAELDRAFIAFKQLADRKKEVFDADIEALVLRSDADQSGPWRLAAMNIRSGKGTVPSAEVALVHADGETRRETAEGDGPVAAAFRAIELATGVDARLRNFDIRNVTVGGDAQGEAVVTVEHDGRVYQGKGFDTDIVEASSLAFLQAINRICSTGRVHPQPDTQNVAAAGSA